MVLPWFFDVMLAVFVVLFKYVCEFRVEIVSFKSMTSRLRP